MTIEEIIKGLRCCAEGYLDSCERCPAMYNKCEQLYAEAADLLSAQQETGELSFLVKGGGEIITYV